MTLLVPRAEDPFFHGYVHPTNGSVLGNSCDPPLIQFINKMHEQVYLMRLVVVSFDGTLVLQRRCTLCLNPGIIGLLAQEVPGECAYLGLQRKSEENKLSMFRFTWSPVRGYSFEPLPTKMMLPPGSLGLGPQTVVPSGTHERPDVLRVESTDLLDVWSTLKAGSFFPSPLLLSVSIRDAGDA